MAQDRPTGANEQEPQRKIAFGPHRIFVSYRRSDTQPWAGRLADDLRRHFGEDRIFRDVDSNRPAQDYRQVIDATLAESRVVVLLLGQNWATSTDAHERPRLLDPNDLVRIELERALANGIPILPVFVNGAGMPAVDQLPVSLQSIAGIEGMRLSDEAWRYDLGRVLERLEELGLLPVSGPGEDDPEALTSRVSRALTGVQRYERSFGVTRPRVYRALLGTVEALRYPRHVEDPEGAQVRFRIYKREITVKVVDAGPGQSKVVVELVSARTGALLGSAATSVVLGPIGVLASAGGFTLRIMDRRFAVGLLDNVQRVLEGRGIGKDSSLPPGIERLRKRSREV